MRFLPVFLLLAASLRASDPDAGPACGTSPDGARNLMAQHDYWTQTRADAADARDVRDVDVDHVAVLEDRGDLVARRNAFDLDRSALRFVPNAAGGYDPVPMAGALEPAGAAVAIGDNEARAFDIPFPFPFSCSCPSP